MSKHNWHMGTQKIHTNLNILMTCHMAEVFAKGQSLIQRGPTECDVSVCDLKTSKIRQPRPK